MGKRRRAIVCVMLGLGLLSASYSAVRYMSSRPVDSERFESSKWLAGSREVRGGLVEDLLASKRLDGMSEGDVLRLLGAPDVEYQGVWGYKVELSHGFLGDVWPYILELEFGDGRQVEQSSLRD